MSWSAQETERLLAALTDLRAAVADARLPLDTGDAEAARALARRVREQLDDHLLPRVRQLGAPLLAVVGGSTGAGKSTLVNSLLRAEVSPSGVIRPTTREPVLVHHPDEGAWFAGDRVLPRLARVTRPGPAPTVPGAAPPPPPPPPPTPTPDGAPGPGGALRLVAHGAVPRGLALVDAPDIDSVVEANRRLGEELLGAADLWVFVTTAGRYADAVPWDLLAEAARRRAVVLVVLNRVEPAARAAVTAHLTGMLTERGLDARVVVVPESPVTGGLLPPGAVAELDAWLRGVVGDAQREDVVRRTVHGAVSDLLEAVPRLAATADDQRRHAERLRDAVAAAYGAAAQDVTAATADGTMLRGEVLARWQEYVGTGELLRALEERVGTWRDRITAALRGRPAPERVARAVGDGLVHLVVDAADRAADRAHAAWHADAAGRALLGGLRLSRASADLAERTAAEVRAWQAGVLDLVSTEGAGRRATARYLSFGVNGLGAALMVAIFASTGGLTTAEVGVAGGTALLAQRLLEAVFGDDAVRRLTQVAHDDLTRRVGALLDAEADRFRTLLDAADVRDGERLRAAVARLAVALAEVGDAPARPVQPPVPDAPAPEPPRQEGALRRWWRRLWAP
jgi:hypothetical protein